MQRLRSVHLYLGCIFAPMLLFFAVSGMWQLFGWNGSGMFQTISTVHTMRSPKGGVSLANPWLWLFVMMMAVSFIVTTVLGVVMALKFGRSRRAAIYCLGLGVTVPMTLVLVWLVR